MRTYCEVLAIFDELGLNGLGIGIDNDINVLSEVSYKFSQSREA